MNLLYDFLFILGIIISGIYIIMLYRLSIKSMPHRLLMLFFSVIIIVLLDAYAILHKIDLLSLITFIPASISKFLLGGLLFLYIKSLFYDDKVVLKKYWIVFIPMILFLILYSIPTLIALQSKKFFLGHLNILYNFNFIVRIISDIILFSYLILCFRTFLRLKKVLKCSNSEITHNNFIWVRYLLVAAMGVIFIDFVFALSLGIFDINGRTQNIVMALLVISIVYAAYFGLNQSKVLVPQFLLEDTVNSQPKGIIQSVSEDNEEQFRLLELKLQRVLLDRKPYLDTELTLSKLADFLMISDKKLSMLLNDYMNVTFYDYINNCRIEAFKEAVKLGKYKNFTIEAIAFECGFKSRATFYRIFKLKTNMSPSEFKNSIG
ncbi:helix-turn-helix domain-containing protein [Crocinitomix catalasitica]|uniref:helix-turn-helix domain-containing protein n=1 Tax=Crocinitomix catalasitica TaxID=184607 RepID=UPI0009FDBE12|nr:helix-turn-helix transcriptional regulator [Crocinitomix catalasitica]